MKIEAKLTLSVYNNLVHIEVNDAKSIVQFLALELTPDQFVRLVGGEGHVECSGEVRELHKVGKQHENKSFEFELPKTATWGNKADFARDLAKQKCPEGWESDQYFGSQGSFFTRDGKDYARVTIRRWK